jgi:hypothetical protein
MSQVGCDMTYGGKMRNKLLALFLGALISFGALFSGTPAMAATGPNTGGNLEWGGPGGPVLANAWTNAWKRGTIKLEVSIYRDGTRIFHHTWTCTSSTACSVNPSPIVLECGCPGEYDLNVYSYGPKTNGVTADDAYYNIIVSDLNGKLKVTHAGPGSGPMIRRTGSKDKVLQR